jgi:hypothetical protein
MASSFRPMLYRTLFALALLSFLTSAIVPGLAFGLQVAITRPTQGATVSGVIWVDVAFRSDSDRPITRLEVYIDDALAREVDLASPLLEGRQSFNWDFSYAASTVHKIGARAIDSSGQANAAAITVQVQNAAAGGPDRIPPVVRVFYPAQGAKLQGQVEIRAEAQDNVGVELVYFYVDGRLHKMMMQAAPYVDLWDTGREADGTHLVEAVAVDAAENEARSAQVTVVVENHSMTLAAPGNVGAAATASPLPTLPTVPATALPIPAALPAVTSPRPVAPAPTVLAAKPAPVLTSGGPAAPTMPQIAPTVASALPVDLLPQAPVAPTTRSAPMGVRTSQPTPAAPARTAPAASRSTLARAARPAAPTVVASLPSPVAPVPVTQPVVVRAATPAPAPPAAVALPRSQARPVETPAAAVTRVGRSTLTPLSPAAAASRPVAAKAVAVVAPIAKPVSPKASPAKPAQRVASAARPSPVVPALGQTALTAGDMAPVSAARMLARLPEPAEFPGRPLASRTAKPAPLSTAAVPLAVAQVRDIKIVFDGEVLTLRTAPETRRGLSLAPLREIFEHTDGVLYWFPVEKKVHAVNKHVDVKLTIGSQKAQVNGETRVLEVAPYLKQGRTMVPLQFIAETLDVRITFDSRTGQILIASNQQ